MIPVNQTIFTVPGGNCFSACVASLLHLNIEDVPYFMEETKEANFDWDRFLKWLDAYDMSAVCLCVSSFIPSETYYILSGKSPRGNFLHSVVGFGEKMEIIHDPHPSKEGLKDYFDYIILVPKDPFKGMKNE